MGGIDIIPYDKSMEEEIQKYRLKDGQEMFVLHPKTAIDLCWGDEERQPFVLMISAKIVGFFILHSGEGVRPFSKQANAVLLRAFSIDALEQGKGYAKTIMRTLPSFVSSRYPDAKELVLAVNKKNNAARSLYEDAYFHFTGRSMDGRSGMQDIMVYQLRKNTKVRR
ncbi:GNAT family N-acetyltransferase [Alkalihalobacillus sp. MEB130]|uniref:GNAT family N-acetyltransferase n=1 Tax=Alkalihalobacillus sp. MEB130 TaxID=2976704 RepID=UPI0028DE5DC8|nr:GNAT family N-acetyltransferase [Alkalihalobacillus sp. MEB130]MDT8860103.1 GNAT family N-acetyltransferase [Alkalihalobacillus sp. MEB130]